MAKTMTASHMTDGQIENAVAKLRDALRKHRDEFGSDPVQEVLGMDNLGMRLLEPFRRLVEVVSVLIVRRVKVNRGRSHHEALQSTNRRFYLDDEVVRTAPQGSGEDAEVIFFPVGRYISDDDLEKEYELRGLDPVDLDSLAAVNEDDPSFADDHPNAIHWQDENGNWCYAAFYRVHDERRVEVYRGAYAWDAFWWFGGVRKLA